jgi:hypothetical protein
MPLFEISGKTLQAIEQTNFAFEKELQRLIECNLETVFNCRMVASEFSTGAQHAGRIDSLALSEDNNPVIIEYKKVESSELINQSLYYLYWIQDHKGDFEIAVQKALGNNIDVDWSDVRVICIAPNDKKYDLHAVQVRCDCSGVTEDTVNIPTSRTGNMESTIEKKSILMCVRSVVRSMISSKCAFALKQIRITWFLRP